MRVTVFGGAGLLGTLVVQELRRRGHEVTSASRRTGADLLAGTGVEAAVRGADAVVDCANMQTASAGKAVTGFGAMARHLSTAVVAAEVPHLVAVSIVGVPSPRLQAKVGYYRGKAEQERVLADSGAPVTIVRTTQWFELARTFLKGRIGPVAIVPHMLAQPVAAATAASVVADAVEAGAGGAERVVAGPEPGDLADLARVIAKRMGTPRVVVAFRIPGADRLFRDGALLPTADIPGSGPTFEQWLVGQPTV